jgi:hypothetical protein
MCAQLRRGEASRSGKLRRTLKAWRCDTWRGDARAAGIHAAGIHAAGIHAAGIHAAGIHAAGIATRQQSSETATNVAADRSPHSVSPQSITALYHLVMHHCSTYHSLAIRCYDFARYLPPLNTLHQSSKRGLRYVSGSQGETLLAASAHVRRIGSCACRAACFLCVPSLAKIVG